MREHSYDETYYRVIEPSRPRWKIWVLAVGAGLVLVAGAGFGGWMVWQRLQPPEAAVAFSSDPEAYQGLGPRPSDPGRDGAISLTGGPVVSGYELPITIQPPPNASEMQLGFDPTFETTPWRPIPPGNEVSLISPNAGYQMVFGRFRARSSTPSGVVTTSVTIDPTFEAATSSAGGGPHQPSWVRPLNRQTLVVRIETGRVLYGQQEPYDRENPPPGDEIKGWLEERVVRDGQAYGAPIAGRDDLIRTYDRFLGRHLDTDAVTEQTWAVTSSVDPNYASPVAVDIGQVVSRPIGSGLTPEGERFSPMAHDYVLRLPTELEPDVPYRLSLIDEGGDTDETVLVTARDFVLTETIVSPGIQVNQHGFAPSDPLKVGYLSAGLAEQSGVTYREGLKFVVRQVDGGGVVYTGETQRRPRGNELGAGDLTGADVFELDFSSLSTPGQYRLCVASVGCSEEFSVDSRVWRELVVTISRSLYHQRSGIALGPPYTAVERPRPYHPADGMRITITGHRLMDNFLHPDDQVFSELVAQDTQVETTDAWGGHFDAGDWDRRAQHLWFARTAAELVREFPDVYGSLTVNIPESDDQLPDLLNEALWTVNAFRRLQRSDGAVSGGIEASEHPQAGTTSWTDPLAVYVYSPDPWSSFVYASAAAQVSEAARPYDSVLADDLLGSAVAAARWAEQEAQSVASPELRRLINEQRAVATAALYSATSQPEWHEAFKSSIQNEAGLSPILSCHAHGYCDAAWVYVNIDDALTDPELRSRLSANLIANADTLIATAATTSYGWAVENPKVSLVWGLGPGGSPSSTGILRAYRLTGDEQYRQAALRSMSVTLGANPIGTVFITGIGEHPVRYPLMVDTINGGVPAWPGTPVYGYHDVTARSGDSWIDEFVLDPVGAYPLAADAPFLWRWHDVPQVAMFTEFTVHQSHAETLYAAAILGASGGK